MVEPIYNNFTAAFMQGRDAGRTIRQQKITDNALAKYASGDMQGGINDLMTVNPEGAFGLQDRQRSNDQYNLRRDVGGMVAGGDMAGARTAAAQGGDFDLINSLNSMDTQQKLAARESAQMIGAVGIRLLSMPVDQRRQALMTMRESFIAKGYPPEQVDRIIADPSDPVLNGVIGQAMTVKDALDWQNDQATLDERIRHNKELESGIKVVGDGAMAINADGDVIANNPKNFAPKSGSGKGTGVAPWQMKW